MTGESTAKLGSVLREVSAAARRAGTPLVTHIVANGVRGDSRVIKSAETSAEQGFATVVIGIVRSSLPLLKTFIWWVCALTL